jgi:uncharacterized protein YcfJ
MEILTMKQTSIAFALLLLTGGSAQAFETVANVVSATPITETVNRPTQNCWTEYQQSTQPAPSQREHNLLGAVIGGVAGGLLGSRMGEGSGKVAAGAVGAGVGAIVGERLGSQEAGAVTMTTPVQRCQQVDHYETVTSGYTVIYEYGGQRFSTRLPYNPGTQLWVNVSVTPR